MHAGLGTSQVAPHAAEEQHSAPAEQVDHDMPGAERMEYRERVPRSSRRERGQRERLPRPVAAALGGAVVESGKAFPVLSNILSHGVASHGCISVNTGRSRCLQYLPF